MVFNKSAEQATHEGVYQLMKDLGVDIAIVKTGSKANSRHKAQVEYDLNKINMLLKMQENCLMFNLVILK